MVLAFVLIPLLAEAFWVFWPALQGFYLSLTSWDGLAAPKFVGLGNYSEMVHDAVFRTAAINTVLWLLLFGGLSAALGLGAAMLLQKERRGIGFYRAALFLPVVFSTGRDRAGVAGHVPAGRPDQQRAGGRRSRRLEARLARRPGHRLLRGDRAGAVGARSAM